MTPDRLDEIDISIAMFRHTHPGSFGEMVGELRAEIDRLADEVDALNSSSDRAATAWHDMVAERDRARQMLRYCFKRWPAPIFWQAAAQIDDPYTALPDWLTADA